MPSCLSKLQSTTPTLASGYVVLIRWLQSALIPRRLRRGIKASARIKTFKKVILPILLKKIYRLDFLNAQNSSIKYKKVIYSVSYGPLSCLDSNRALIKNDVFIGYL